MNKLITQLTIISAVLLVVSYIVLILCGASFNIADADPRARAVVAFFWVCSVVCAACVLYEKNKDRR